MKKAIFGIILLVVFGFWLSKVIEMVETSDKNERATANNEIVAVINDLQDKLREPQILFEQFIDLSNLTESQQRGTWGLLELIEIDFSEEINAAKTTLTDINVGDNPSLLALKENGLALVASYQAYTQAYQNIKAKIETKQLSGAEVEALIATEMNKVSLATADAAETVRVAQEKFLRGD